LENRHMEAVLINLDALKTVSHNERTMHAIFLVAGVAILAYVVASTSVSDVIEAFSLLGAGAAVVAAITILGLAIRAIRLKLLMKSMAYIPFWSMFMIIYETALFSVYSPGKVGEMMKLDMFKKHGVRRAQSASAIIVERAYDLAVVAALSAGVLVTLGINVLVIAASCLAAIAVAAFLYRSGAFGGLFRTVVDSMKMLLNVKIAAAMLALTLLLWLVDTSALYFVLRALGHDVRFDVLVPVYFASVIVGLVSMIPGGLGSMDFTFSYGLAATAGVPAADAMATVLAPRIITFLVCLVGSALYFIDMKAAIVDG